MFIIDVKSPFIYLLYSFITIFAGKIMKSITETSKRKRRKRTWEN
jgi:hypothetical protein